MSYQEAAITRQAILDYLHANPLSSAVDLAAGTGATRNAIGSALKFQTERREIEKEGNGKATLYRAIATQTQSAESVIELVRQKREAKGIEKAPKPSKCPPWVTRSCDVRNPFQDQPIQNQGGQGSVPRGFGVQSSANWI